MVVAAAFAIIQIGIVLEANVMWGKHLSKTRTGLTMVELLIVAAISGILVGLLLPAIQKMREAASRVKCSNNLKQLGLAVHMHHNDKHRLPPGGRIRNWPPEGTADRWEENQGSWLLHVLPYLEQQPLYDRFKPYLKADDRKHGETDKNTEDREYASSGNCGSGEPCSIRQVKEWHQITSPFVLRCPSYRHDWEGWPATNYAGSIGPQCVNGPCLHDPYLEYCNQPEYGIPRELNGHAAFGDWAKTSTIRGCFNRTGARVQIKDIRDGLSNTIMIGEFSPQEHDHATPTTHYTGARGHWLDANAGYGHVHTLAPINHRSNREELCNENPLPGPITNSPELLEHSNQNWHFSWGFKSRHPRGANFLFADGSVHFVEQHVNHQLYQFLGCRNDGQTVNLDSTNLPPGPTPDLGRE